MHGEGRETAGLPADVDARVAGSGKRVETDFPDQTAHHAFAVSGGRRGGVPDLRQICDQLFDQGTVSGRKGRQRSGLFARVLLFQALECLKCGVPLRLEFTGDKSVFGFHAVVLPVRALDFIARPLQALLPELF